uniref:Uncharacterized protein n=1 Tax=Anguilla anguilla TaxID=7936 RepID=A0A0E9QIG9_ANGAN
MICLQTKKKSLKNTTKIKTFVYRCKTFPPPSVLLGFLHFGAEGEEGKVLEVLLPVESTVIVMKT